MKPNNLEFLLAMTTVFPSMCTTPASLQLFKNSISSTSVGLLSLPEEAMV
ncbi:hypothetical protein Leryth_025597 [Lithospermum erythrorhizon]|nr:hypothetical protein Leryth_025597 [Lithospermum erythrorhizon]